MLVDTNATQGDKAITDYYPSPDGTQVAYGTAEGGTESTTIHFVEVSSGRVMLDALPHAGGGTTPQSLAWDADGNGVTYVRLPLPGSVPPEISAKTWATRRPVPAKSAIAADSAERSFGPPA